MNKNTRSKSYQFTANVNSVVDMQQIELLRSSIKSVNAMAKEKDRMNEYCYDTGYHDVLESITPKYRVLLMPRGPRRAAAIADGRSPRSYDSTLPIRHAETIDVYIHERR
jgi:hypothetical protein